jgi:hypothetical protein
MDVWMPILPTRATEMAHPDIRTWADAVSARVIFFTYVYFCPCGPRKRSYTHENITIHTYIHGSRVSRKRVDISMYVSISSALAAETIYTWTHAVSKSKKVVES